MALSGNGVICSGYRVAIDNCSDASRSGFWLANSLALFLLLRWNNS